MTLAVQVVTYKSSGDFPEMLASLKAQTFTDWKLFVCENSLDRVEAGKIQERLAASSVPHHFFISDHNGGFDGGHMTLYRMHEAPFVMLLNADAKLEPTYLENVMRRIESDPKIASVTGLAYRWDGKTIDTAGLEYRCLGNVVDRFAGRSESELLAYSPTSLLASEVFGVSGAIGLYRRSAVEQAGGLFDPAWFMYKEDVDLAIRLRRAGFTAWFEPAAVAWHKRGLKEEKGIVARFRNECRRPSILRRSSYVNQWRIYRRYWKTIGWRDRLCTVKAEIGRTALFLLASLCSRK